MDDLEALKKDMREIIDMFRNTLGPFNYDTLDKAHAAICALEAKVAVYDTALRQVAHTKHIADAHAIAFAAVARTTLAGKGEGA